MRIMLKILAAPAVAVLTVSVAVFTFLFCVAGALCTVSCIGMTILAIVLLIGKELTGSIVFFVIAFLLSPFGLPAVADWLIEKLNKLNYSLRDFITG